MTRSIAKYILFVSVLLAVPWAILEWRNSGSTYEDQVKCVAAWVPFHDQGNAVVSLDHHMMRAREIAKSAGREVSRFQVLQDANSYSKAWLKSAKSSDDFRDKLMEARRRCAGT